MIAMEACLVRIMKARKKAAHTDLVEEAVSHMSRLFKVRWRQRERQRERERVVKIRLKFELKLRHSSHIHHTLGCPDTFTRCGSLLDGHFFCLVSRCGNSAVPLLCFFCAFCASSGLSLPNSFTGVLCYDQEAH